MMQLIPEALRALLLANGQKFKDDISFDPFPVLKLFTPDAAMTWLLAAIDPDDCDLAYGLCDAGLGCPEVGNVSLEEIASLRGRHGLPVERDLYFDPDKPISAYARAAARAGRFVP
jgi:hypothetical protein